MFAACFPLIILDILDAEIPLSALNFRKERDCFAAAAFTMAPNCDVPSSGIPFKSRYSLIHIPPLLFHIISIFTERSINGY
jgi:hypothetical protein